MEKGINRDNVVRYLVKTTPKRKQTGNPGKYPQGRFKDKSCRIDNCDMVFSPKAPSEHYCSDGCANQGYTENYLKRTYGITLDQYVNAYIDQEGKCKICKGEGFDTRRKGYKEQPPKKGQASVSLCVDHDHTTGKFRGLLCHRCNTGIGNFKENIQSLKNAIEYLESVETIPEGSTPK